MNDPKKIISGVLAALMLSVMLSPSLTAAHADNMYENSDFIETEQPALTEESMQLIAQYQQEPSEENYLALRDNVIKNYEAVLDKKEAKLEELKTETEGKPGGDDVVAEMEDIVQEMYINYWNRINSSMLRFTDSRLLKWKTDNAAQYDYIPVMGAGESIYIGYTPVTNAEYAEYLAATGAAAPENWTDGTYPEGEADYPVNAVSYEDAENYCDWLTQQDGTNTYRLPSESEWELAAGHMPKDADFNCGITDGRTPVDEYAGITRGAHGAIDFWGNVWEWTSTVREETEDTTILGVKGGSWKSERTDCRTEYRDEGRDATSGYDDVGFRVIQVKGGVEPTQKVELATLDAPVISDMATTATSITLSWQAVDGATEYQLFEYFRDSGLVEMLDTTTDTTITMAGLEPGSTHYYIVQPISYVEIADNVSYDYSVGATCREEDDTTEESPAQTTITLQLDSPSMTVNGETTTIDALGTTPLLMNDRTLLPIRAIVEALGGTVNWNADTRTATLTLADNELRLTANSTTAYFNGTATTLDTAPVIINDRTMFPIRFVAESFGFAVNWDEQNKTVTISADR